MKNTLGLDLGSNSLGWAIIDDITGDIHDKGVVVFPEGIDAANDTLETPAAARRKSRMGRRMKFRRKLRKWHLLSLLIKNKMCPLTEEELKLWKTSGKYPVSNRVFLAWLKSTDTSNPYCDRAACLDGKVEPEVLGRALYHICQRRGFKSSRKDAAPDTGDDEADRKAVDKKLGKVKTDINELSAAIKDSSARTLGEYFFRLMESQKESIVKKRVRAHYTGRIEHYMTEFTAIMDAQKIDADLRKKLYEAIFMQRPLRSQKNLVGKCPLEPKYPRAMIGHPDYEEFRMLAFVNNLSFDDLDGNRHPLTPSDRDIVCKAFLKASPNMKFADISKQFKKDPRFAKDGWKFHYYRDDESVATCSVRHRITRAFGGEPYDEQLVFDALTFYNDDELLKGWFKKHYPCLNEASISKLVGIHPKEGNAKYSLKAIRRILRFLRKGFELSQARFYAKLPDIIENFDANEESILLNLQEILIAYRKDRASMADDHLRKTNKLEPLLERYHEYLRDNWNVDEEGWSRLYLRGDEVYAVDPEKPNRLPVVNLGMIRNPLVQRSMTTLRRLVNYLNDHGKIDSATTVRIELARNVNNLAARQAIATWQKSREALREEAKKEISKFGVSATEDAIERYVLWQEQGEVCFYTGKTISLADLLRGNKFDIEHTIPRSRSGDDSLANKTICEADYNRQKKQGRIPRECDNWDEINARLQPWRNHLEQLKKEFNKQNLAAKSATDPEAHHKARCKVLVTKHELDYWANKLKRFEVTSDKLVDPANGLSGFKKRQLVDTGIMSSHAVALLRSVYPATYAVNGAATAFARKAWGIQGDEAKDRSEHTHHAKDAMVIAALTPSRFSAICTALRDDGSSAYRRPCDVCPVPWPGFAEKVRKAADEILVKHVLRQTTLRQSSKRNALVKAHAPKGDPNGKKIKYVLSRGDTVRGPLHKDTFYGCIAEPSSGKLKKVIRKSLIGQIKEAEGIVEKIVDPAIKDIVFCAIKELKRKGVKNIEPDMVKMPSGVPVNKVRVYAANAANAQVLHDQTMTSDKEYKNHYYVTSAEGSNFRLALFDKAGKFSVECDNALTWAQTHKKPDYLPFDEQKGFKGYVMPGNMALIYHEGSPRELETLNSYEIAQRLYKIVKFRSDGLITLRFHREARPSVVLSKDLKDKGKHAAGESRIAFDNPHELLLISPGVYSKQVLFENIDFKMNLDGTIQFIRR